MARAMRAIMPAKPRATMARAVIIMEACATMTMAVELPGQVLPIPKSTARADDLLRSMIDELIGVRRAV
ncbi:hypothetical protein D3C79_1073970 [compost metagenome]